MLHMSICLIRICLFVSQCLNNIFVVLETSFLSIAMCCIPCSQVAVKIIDKTQLNPTSLQKVSLFYTSYIWHIIMYGITYHGMQSQSQLVYHDS